MLRQTLLICIRVFNPDREPVIKFTMVGVVIGTYVLAVFSIRPYRKEEDNFLDCSLQVRDGIRIFMRACLYLQLMLVCFMMGGLLNTQPDTDQDSKNLAPIILWGSVFISFALIVWAITHDIMHYLGRKHLLRQLNRSEISRLAD